MGRAAPDVAPLLAERTEAAGPPLVSARTPPDTDANGPRPRASLPPGAAGRGGGSLAMCPNPLGLLLRGQ